MVVTTLSALLASLLALAVLAPTVMKNCAEDARWLMNVSHAIDHGAKSAIFKNVINVIFAVRNAVMSALRAIT